MSHSVIPIKQAYTYLIQIQITKKILIQFGGERGDEVKWPI